MIKTKIKISNKLGLHARPCTEIVKVTEKYVSDFQIVKDGTNTNGKSILGLMMLAATQGTELTLITEGDDEKHMMQELVSLFENKFGEE